MNTQIKALAEAITHGHTRNLAQTHIKDLRFKEDARHLVIYLDNAAPLRALEALEGEEHLKKGLEEVYGKDITYDMRLHHYQRNEREKAVPHNIYRCVGNCCRRGFRTGLG